LRAGHYWPWISVYFEGIAANKQGIDGQWPPLNSRPGNIIFELYHFEEKFKGKIIER
jgi:hypothetical protein